MSEEQALSFLAAVRRDEGLRAAVAQCTGADALARLVALARDAGYEFTEDDYRNAVVREAQGELSDEALDDLVREMRGEREGGD